MMPPLNHTSQFLNNIYSLTLLIIVSTYTANLASYLIASSPKPNPLVSIDYANTQRLKICVEANSFSSSILSTYYSRVQRIEVANSVAVMQGVAKQSCDGGVLGIGSYQINQMVTLT